MKSEYTELSQIEKEFDRRDRNNAIILWTNVFGIIAGIWTLLLLNASPLVALAVMCTAIVIFIGEVIQFGGDYL